jgi:serine O-acetyltransferase
MSINLDKARLRTYLSKQFDNFFPDSKASTTLEVAIIERSLQRSFYCFKGINSPIYRDLDGDPKFNHLHGDQYATFLYFVSSEAFQAGNEEVYYKAALLNKALHGIDLFGHVKMPDRFLLVHPVGTIIGRAKIGENVVIYQGVTIGGKHDKNGDIIYPSIGRDCVLFSNASVIGASKLQKKTIVAANTFLLDFNLNSEGKLVVGSYPNIIVKDNSQNFPWFK